MKPLEQYPLPYISYSQLSSYLSCSFTFYQSYVMKNRDSGNKYSKLGNVFHEIAEKYPQSGDPKEIGREYSRLFKEIPVEMFDSKEERQEFFDKGIVAIRNFGRHYKDAPEPLFVELKVEVPIIDGLPPSLSFIDRIDGEKDKPETYIITDYKTSNAAWPKSKLAEQFQLGFYALQCYKKFGAWPMVVQYYFPVPDKWVIAVHIGDGVYEYQNQKSPVLQINVADVIAKCKFAYDGIMAGEFKETLCGTFFCNKFCFFKKQGIHPDPPQNAYSDWGNV